MDAALEAWMEGEDDGWRDERMDGRHVSWVDGMDGRMG